MRTTECSDDTRHRGSPTSSGGRRRGGISSNDVASLVAVAKLGDPTRKRLGQSVCGKALPFRLGPKGCNPRSSRRCGCPQVCPSGPYRTRNLTSKIHADRQYDRRIGPAEIEHVRGKVELLIRESCQQTPLNVEVCFVDLSPLDHQACPEPIQG